MTVRTEIRLAQPADHSARRLHTRHGYTEEGSIWMAALL